MPNYLLPIDKQHPQRVALMFGPVVLVRQRDFLRIPADGNLSKWLTRDGKPLEFRAGEHSRGIFVPFYRVERDVPYDMYFDLES
jgi:hypothetical protein